MRWTGAWIGYQGQWLVKSSKFLVQPEGDGLTTASTKFTFGLLNGPIIISHQLNL